MLGSRLPATFAGLTLVAALAAPTGTTAAAPAGAIAWTTCEQPAAAKYQARCGTVRVPVDWAKPSGPSIALALLRVPATGDSTGTVVSDSEELAGYGGSQISFFLQHGGNYLSRLPRTHATKDIVIFDPRGLGGSAGVHCAVPGHDPAVSSFATSVGTYDRLLAHNAATFAGCQGTAGLTAHMGVHDQVRDLDAIRSALGESRLNWLARPTAANAERRTRPPIPAVPAPSSWTRRSTRTGRRRYGRSTRPAPRRPRSPISRPGATPTPPARCTARTWARSSTRSSPRPTPAVCRTKRRLPDHSPAPKSASPPGSIWPAIPSRGRAWPPA